MIRTRLSLAALAAALTSMVGLLAIATAATASPVRQQPQVTASAATSSAVTAPTNLRVRQLTATSVTFEWDHSQGATPGCTLSLILYTIYVNGKFHGWTYWGSPVGLVAQLRPATTYKLQVQGQDNCSGNLSPLSQPLIITTPRR
jgi:hypothetical protein